MKNIKYVVYFILIGLVINSFCRLVMTIDKDNRTNQIEHMNKENLDIMQDNR